MTTNASAAEMVEGEFEDTPEAQARRWAMEFAAWEDEVQKWHIEGEEIVSWFLDERGLELDRTIEYRVNLFSANVQTIRAIMYGKTPTIDVCRRFADSADDVARCSAEMLGRVLNTDIQRDGDTYAAALGQCLDDRLLPGLSIARIRYEIEEEEVPGKPAMMGTHPETGEPMEMAPEVPPTTRKTYECVETDYIPWKDFAWSPCRVWSERRWVGFKAQMSRKQLIERFGEEIGKEVPLNTKRQDDYADTKTPMPWDRADVWEFWDKEKEKVYWWVKGYGKTLDTKDDPLGLEGFFPCPKPIIANPTTRRFLPRPDFALAADIYKELNLVSSRIRDLARMVNLRGVYDKTNEGLKRLLSEASKNQLIPVENWPMVAEKGGLKGLMDFIPLEEVAAALDKLRDYRTELINLGFQVTGMSDIVRGQADASATATEQSIKAKFASVRLQALQDEFARFATDLQRLKAEVISKHFDPQTILEASNMQYTPDAKVPGLLEQAAALIKSNHFAYRIEVKPESVSLTDYAAMRQESMEVLQGLGGYMQMAAPLGMQVPQLAPALLQLLQWTMSRIRGSDEIESILDQAIQQAQQAAAQPPAPQGPPPPDPKAQAAMIKGRMDIQKEVTKGQVGLQQIAAQSQADTQHQVAQTHFNIIEAQAKERAKTLASIGQAINPPGVTEGGA